MFNSRARTVAKSVAAVFSLAFCIVPAGATIWAWNRHFEWVKNGDYARNSFPMEQFAIDMTWASFGATLLCTLAWCFARRWWCK